MATKYDNQKVQLDLLPYDSLVEIARVLEFGATKYSAGNYMKGLDIRRLISACLRHIMQFNNGENIDMESGHTHLGHAACNLMFAIWMMKNKPEMDNRWIKEYLDSAELLISE
jgi:Domain of unknown function (DUF5664)